MGNSGGAWLMKVFNMHENILMFQELNQILRLRYDYSDINKKNLNYPHVDYDVKIAQRSRDLKGFLFNSRTQCHIATSFLLYQYDIRKEDAIGLIKCFDHESIRECRVKCPSVKVVQVLRNPIGIIDFYMSQENLRQIAHHDPYEISFKKHVDFFHNKFIDFWENNEKKGEKIIRLEDLNISLKDGNPFLKDTMEDLFEVNFSNEFIEKIKQNLGYGNEGNQNKEIWQNWEGWKKEYFKKYFENLMMNLGYELR